MQVLSFFNPLLYNIYILLIRQFRNDRAYFFYSCYWKDFDLTFLGMNANDEFLYGDAMYLLFQIDGKLVVDYCLIHAILEVIGGPE